jgi:hypothetical protein
MALSNTSAALLLASLWQWRSMRFGGGAFTGAAEGLMRAPS